MTTQNVISGIVVTIILVVALIAANVYLVQPSVNLPLSPLPPLPPAGQGAPRADESLVAATLEQIGAVQSGGEQATFAPREVARNPFLWPGEREALAAAEQARLIEQALPEGQVAAAEEEAPSVVVSMILLGENRKIAVINDQFVRPGDKFENSRISRIEKDAVTLVDSSGNSRRIALGALTAAFGPQSKKAVPAPSEAVAGPGDMLQPLGGTGPALTPALGGAPTPAAQQEAIQRLMERLGPLMTPPAGGS